MRRRRPPGPPPEMPAELRVFDPDRWPGRDVWSVARFEWGEAHGINALEMLRQQYPDRRAAVGLPCPCASCLNGDAS